MSKQGILTFEQKLETVYKNFIEEAELFFVTKFIESESIKKKFTFCLDVLFNITGSQDVNRGIWAFDKNYGRGKTFFFDVVHHRMRRKKGVNMFKKTSALELVDIYLNSKNKTNPTKELDEFIQAKKLFIDDLGTELKDGGASRVVYGNKLNIMRYVLLKRYDLWKDKGYITHGTTNLDISGIVEHYGDRTADRFKEMTHQVNFDFLKQGSFRQFNDTRRLTREEIRLNHLKVQPKKKQEVLNLEEYFNEMLQLSEERIEMQPLSFWIFCRTYLIAKNEIKESDFIVIDDEKRQASRAKLIHDKKQEIKQTYRNAPAGVLTAKIDEMKANITKEEVQLFAECNVVKNVFKILQQQNHKF